MQKALVVQEAILVQEATKMQEATKVQEAIVVQEATPVFCKVLGLEVNKRLNAILLQGKNVT